MDRDQPVLIQGGMGVAVSNWRLARAVAQAGHMGVVSGTALDSVMVRRLQLGDPDGHVRRALDQLPLPGAAARIVDRYFVPGGKQDNQRFVLSPTKRHRPSRNLEDLLIAANFVEVYLAKEGHDGLVGINYLEKVQSPTLPSLYGAMLAGVDHVLMGAGIPKSIPAVLDDLARGSAVELKLDVKGATRDDDFALRFDPAEAMGGRPPIIERPAFLAIVSSHVLAVMLATKTAVPVDGFIVEGATAGGHNAPPRGKLQLTGGGEPIYGERDLPDLGVFRELGLPFWLAGGRASAGQVDQALAAGAAGVQVGTAFAYCEESGFDPEIKRRVIDLSRDGEVEVFTDPKASPSGFPFKVVQLEGTLSDPEVYEGRHRETCDLGFLRSAYRDDDGSLGWRCPAEPVEIYIGKGGAVEDTEGRKCLCNSLLAGVGLAQVQREGGAPEPVLITSGDDVSQVAQFLPPGADSYRAIDVINHLRPDTSRGITPELLARHDRPGPRYTSYPTAVDFHDGFGPDDYAARLTGAAGRVDDPLSLYVHLPFCDRRCSFCACHVVVTADMSLGDAYLDRLVAEARTVAARLGERRVLQQYHWGGGTPTFHPPETLVELHRQLLSEFELAPGAEVALEVDPRVTTGEHLAALHQVGFNRISFGVQDADERVQDLIGRHQTWDQTVQLHETARGLGFSSINLDLIYGLPGQDADSFARSLELVIGLRPDRIAAYSFALVPWMRPHQKRIDATLLPDRDLKFELLSLAISSLIDAGYHQIGMDHFALPDDELATAYAGRTMSRNFMGYTTKRGTEIVGLGTSAISDIGAAYAQNHRRLASYYQAVDAGELPVERGIALDDEDRLRRHVITELMCNGRLLARDLTDRFGIDLADHFGAELAELHEPGGLVEAGFVTVGGRGIETTPEGRLFIRNVAMVFDARTGRPAGAGDGDGDGVEAGPRFSRTV